MERKKNESENQATRISNLESSPGPGKKPGKRNVLSRFLNWLATGAEKDQAAQDCSQ